MLCNEKYKGDFHLQKYYTPENKRNHTRKNNGEVQRTKSELRNAVVLASRARAELP